MNKTTKVHLPLFVDYIIKECGCRLWASIGDREESDEDIFDDNFQRACFKLKKEFITKDDLPELRRHFENQNWKQDIIVNRWYSYDIGAIESIDEEFDFKDSAMDMFDELFAEEALEGLFDGFNN